MLGGLCPRWMISGGVVESNLDVKLSNVKVYTMRELNQNTAHVVDEINDSGNPAVITKHGRFVALITPLRDSAIEEMVLSSGRIAKMLDERADDVNANVLSSDEVMQRFDDRKNR